MKKHNSKYTYQPGEGGCFYCCAPASTIDHVPPLVYVDTMDDFDETLRYVTVPACLECNALASSKTHRTLTQRRRYLAAAYRRRSARLLRAPRWTPDELAELGPGLRSHIEHTDIEVEFIRKRIAKLDQKSRYETKT